MAAGTGINLMLGALYTWSIFKSALETEYGLTAAQGALPYTVSCLVFSLMMVPAGRMQDRLGPRITATLGGLLVGAGFVITSLVGASQSPMAFLIPGFGVLAGAGIGFGYAATTPPAVKWFPPQRQGLIVGIVVGGVGLASVYAAPLIEYLIGAMKVAATFRVLGVAFLAAIVIFAQFLKNPPENDAHTAGSNEKSAGETASDKTIPEETKQSGTGFQPFEKAPADRDYTWRRMMRTRQFILIWIMFFFGAGAGLMLISFAKSMAKGSIAGMGYLLVAILAAGNAGGRITAGAVSDRLGRTRTLLLVFVLQAVMLALMSRSAAVPALLIFCIIMVGFNYGACLSVFPSITADYFGLKNLGVNYGIVFTAWGFGSGMATVAGRIKDATGGYTPALILAAALCLVAAAMTFLLKPPARGTAKP